MHGCCLSEPPSCSSPSWARARPAAIVPLKPRCSSLSPAAGSSVASQRSLGSLQPSGIVAARVARPVLGIVDNAGEQAAGLLAVVGLRLRHQPFGVEAAGSRIVSAFQGALECGAGSGGLRGCQCLRVQQGLFRLAAHVRVACEQAVQRLHRKLGLPGIEAGTGKAGQDVGIVAQRRTGCLLQQGSGFLRLAGIQQRHAQANPVLHGGRARQFGTGVAKVLARVHELLGGTDDLSGAPRVADFREVDRQEVDDAAEQWEREEQDEPVEVLARADGVHREVDGGQYVESDSDIGHVGCFILVRGWNYSGGGVGPMGGTIERDASLCSARALSARGGTAGP